MPTVNWGMLAKSQDDPETIEEAIARIIAEHNDDEEAHLSEGQSLSSHKAAEIIDHLAASIIADKIKDREVGNDKLSDFNKICYSFSLESLDSWLEHADFSLNPGEIYLQTGGVINTTKRGYCENSNILDTRKEMQAQFVFSLGQITNQIFYLVSGDSYIGDTECEAIGFKVVNGELFAFSTNTDGGSKTEYTTKIADIVAGQIYVARFYYVPGSYIKFYLDDVLVATHSSNLPSQDNYSAFMVDISLKNTAAENKVGYIYQIYLVRDL